MKKKQLTISCLLLLAAAVSSCSSDDALVVDQAAGNGGARRYTMTVEARKGGDLTRALSEGTDGSISATWTKGDTVSVYSDNKKLGKLTAQADGASVTLSGELSEAPADQAELTLKYLSPDYANQDGTLTGSETSIDRVCDYATATVTATVSGTTVTTTGNADFQNQQAIMKLTLQDQGGSSISATQLLVILGDDTVTVTPAEPASQLYVAVPAVSEPTTLKMEATVDGATYSYEKTDVTITAGSSYGGEVKMTPPVIDLSMVDCAGKARSGMTTANCYMIHKAGQYKLPLVYGNAIKDGKDNITAYKPGGTASETYCVNFVNHAGDDIDAPWITKATDGEGVNKGMGITVSSADLLWQDAEDLITAVGISGDYLMLTVGKDATDKQGNAVVAAKDADGTIVWSWHIWVTTETFADNTLTTITTGTGTLGTDYQVYKVTPVNLGWVSTSTDGKQGYNTFYQWGRKDPFKGTGAPTDKTVYDVEGTSIEGLNLPSTDDANTATIADNIKNPTTHYYNNNTSGPCTTKYYNMWDARQTGTDNIATATVKTVYDPSPAGFCVPTDNFFYFMANGDTSEEGSWDGTNKGRTFDPVNSNVFFPASGYRHFGDGSLIGVGSCGFCWSASAGGRYSGHGLYFDSSGWYRRSYNRARGFSVRAVAEE